MVIGYSELSLLFYYKFLTTLIISPKARSQECLKLSGMRLPNAPRRISVCFSYQKASNTTNSKTTILAIAIPATAAELLLYCSGLDYRVNVDLFETVFVNK